MPLSPAGPQCRRDHVGDVMPPDPGASAPSAPVTDRHEVVVSAPESGTPRPGVSPGPGVVADLDLAHRNSVRAPRVTAFAAMTCRAVPCMSRHPAVQGLLKSFLLDHTASWPPTSCGSWSSRTHWRTVGWTPATGPHNVGDVETPPPPDPRSGEGLGRDLAG